jgi:hypothetical protein
MAHLLFIDSLTPGACGQVGERARVREFPAGHSVVSYTTSLHGFRRIHLL